jgi:transposase
MLKTNTATTVWQRLRDEAGLAVSLTSFRRYVWSEFPGQADQSKVTVARPEVPAGEEVQIDYGFLGSWLDPLAQRVRRVWAFVMVLACSRHMFVRPVFSMDRLAWVATHVKAFAFFGGVSRRLVSDNLKTGVIKPDLYDPKLNRAYAELAAHYGCLIDPARASKPKDKALASHCTSSVVSDTNRLAGPPFSGGQAKATAAQPGGSARRIMTGARARH